MQVLASASDSKFEKVVTTDAAGIFHISGLDPGVFRILVTAPGFFPQSAQVEVQRSNRKDVDLRLVPLTRVAALRAAEERNPNIFISKIDLNALRDPIRRGGINPVFLEFTSKENLYGADYGAPLRQIIVASPAPPRERFRGSLYEAHQNSVLNARPFFNVGPLKPSRRNQFGFTTSGPIVQKKLFFSTSMDVVRESGFVNGNIRVPLPEERTPLTTDPLTRRVVSALFEAYPQEIPNLPGVLARQLNTNSERRIKEFNWTLKTDCLMSENEKLAFQYALSDYTEDPFELVLGQYPDTKLRPQSFSSTYVRELSDRTTVQASFYFDRLRALLLPTEKFDSLLKSVGLGETPDISFGGELAEVTSLGPGTQFPRRRYQNRYGVNFDFSTLRGQHKLQMGARTIRIQLNDLQSDNGRGRFVFGNNFGRTALENFRWGAPTRFTITLGNLYRGFRSWEHAFYLQDSIRLRPNLSLTLGMRYELLTVPTEVNNLTELGYRADANNWGPLVAFAWNPGKGSTTIRSGYMISYGHIFPATYQQARFNPPSVQTITVQNPSFINPLRGIEIKPGEVRRNELSTVSPDLVAPYAHQYNLVIEKSLGGNLLLEAGYVGIRSIKLFFPVVTNRAEPVPGIPATIATIDQRRPDPRYLAVRTIINSGMSYYDALKLGLRKRFSQGLSLDLEYVFSKDLTSGYDFASTLNRETAQPASQSQHHFQADLKGPSIFDSPHALIANYTYRLPLKLSGTSFWATLLNDWQLSGSTVIRTGTFFDFETSSDAPGFGNVDGEGLDRPNVTNPSILGKSIDNPDTSTSILRPEYFNTQIPPGGRGNLGLRVFRKDSLNNTNLGLIKTFPSFREGQTLQFRADFYNFFNHPFFERPGDVFPSPTFGKITDTQNKGRVIQFQLRYSF